MSRSPMTAPLVARSQQLTALRQALGRAAQGQAGTVLLSGDAGAGKTRLVDEVASTAQADGATVLVGHCIDLGGVGLPYLPFAEALSRVQALALESPAVAAALQARPALGRLVGAAEPAAAGEEEVGRLQLFDAVDGLLTELGRSDGPVLLVLEDLHWADQSTRDLLRFLVSRARDQRLLILATYRADDLHRRHPLRPLLAELLRHPTVERLEVPPFTEKELREFVATVTTGGVPEREIRRVIERSEGNAYFAEELLESGAEQDGLPDSLSDVLLARVERLDAAVVRLVRVASVAGRRVSEPLLRAVSGLTAGELDDVLREAVTHHVLVPAESGYFAFRHALLAEAIYSDLLPGERVRLHAAYAAALADGRLGSAAELAHHLLASHDLPAALSASLAAADEAARRLAPTETLRHLETALQLWGAVPDAAERSGGDQVSLLVRAAHHASQCGELDRGIALAREAVTQAAHAADPSREAVARAHLAQYLMNADLPGAWAHSARALHLLTSGAAATEERAKPGRADLEEDAVAPPSLPEGEVGEELLKAASVHARTSINSGRDDEARRWAQWVLERSRRLALPELEADVLTTLAVLESDSPDVAADLLRRAQARAADAGGLGVELRSTYNLASNRYYTGDVRAALEQTEAGLRRAEESGTRWSVWAIELRVLDVIARYVTGDWSGSRASASLVGPTPPDLVAARLSAAALYTAVGSGDADALAATQRLRPSWRLDGQIALVAGGCQVDALTWEGRYEEAAAVAQTVIAHMARAWDDYFLGGIWLSALAVSALADQLASQRGRTAAELQALRVQADRLLAHAVTTAERGRPRFGRLGPEGRGWLARVHAEHARAHGRPDTDAWVSAVGEFGDGYPYEQARSRWRLAEALLETGDRAGAASQLCAAWETARELGAHPLVQALEALDRRGRLEQTTPAGTAAGADLLTPRESAVLSLVAEGLTNRQVGQRLFISDKTVSVHLSNVMAKLGAGSRTEAVSVAYRRGLLQRDGQRPAPGRPRRSVG